MRLAPVDVNRWLSPADGAVALTWVRGSDIMSSETRTVPESDRAHSRETPVRMQRSFRSGQSDQTPNPAESVSILRSGFLLKPRALSYDRILTYLARSMVTSLD